MTLQKYTAPLVALLVVAAFASPALADDNVRRDGNWWQTQAPFAKISYMVGFIDGMELGQDFSTWKYSHSTDAADVDASAKAFASYVEYTKKYLTNVTVGQIVDGLNAFYGDYKNRRIQTSGAVWLVLLGIAGVPAEELNKKIENWRRNSAPQ